MAYQYFVPKKDSKAFDGHEKTIITEGEDDALFIESMLLDMGIAPKTVAIRDAGSNTAFNVTLSLLAKGSTFRSGGVRRVGIFADADTNFMASQLNAQNAFRAANLPVPDAGHTVNRDHLRCGLYLFPGQNMVGDLEDMCLQAMGETLQTRIARHAFGEVTAAGVELTHRSKREMQIVTALSPGRLSAGVGRAIRNGVLAVHADDHPNVLNFLRALLLD